MFFRFLIWSLVFYLIARFLWRYLSPFFGPSRPDGRAGNASEPPAKPKEEFKDVRDAKFIDVPKPPGDSGERENEN